MPRAAMSVATSVLTRPARKRGQRAVALVLRLVAVDCVRAEALLHELAHDLVGAMLGAREDQGAVDGLAPQDVGQESQLAASVDMHDALIDLLDGRGDRRHRDAGRIVQHLARQILDLARHGGREEQGLPLGRQFRDDFADVVDEAHVEHAVGFVEDEDFDAMQLHRMRCRARSSSRPGVATRMSTPLESLRCLADESRRRRWRARR